MTLTRFSENPLIGPADVKPSRDDLEVVCAFNCGAIRMDNDILLLLRVAERPPVSADERVAPRLDPEDVSKGLQMMRVKRSNPDLEEIDSRVFRYRGRLYLTSISHLRLAHSSDGRRFTVQDTPALFPATREEEYGIEDPRITLIDGEYQINYTAVSRNGIATALASTRDFESYQRRGIIFAPDNRDVTIFPEKLGRRYLCFHRPMGARFGQQNMWAAQSPDLLHWGRHQFVCECRPGMWDELKVGGGAIPIRTEAGWLHIYHGADRDQKYCLGLLLTDLEQPHRVIARSEKPILSPEADYERKGFFGNVVFTCGAVSEPDGRVLIYYGASDQYTCCAETTIAELLETLKN